MPAEKALYQLFLLLLLLVVVVVVVLLYAATLYNQANDKYSH